jgi:hypothetical protein
MSILNQHRNYPPAVGTPVRSTASVVAILCALGSFYLSGHHHQLFGFIAAIVAIAAGLLGGIRALSPRVAGGMLSIAAVALGVIAILYAILAVIF